MTVQRVNGVSVGSHRIVPVSQEWDYVGPTEWRCLACHAVRRFEDEFDDFECNAVSLFESSTG